MFISVHRNLPVLSSKQSSWCELLQITVTYCLRISWLIRYHCLLVSMDVEYCRIFTSADSTAIHDCVWLFILLAVSLAVKGNAFVWNLDVLTGRCHCCSMEWVWRMHH